MHSQRSVSISVFRLAFGLTGLCACVSSDPVEPLDYEPGALSAEVRGRVVLVDQIDSAAWPSDTLAIESSSIDGDTLRLRVSYGGGCRTHLFQVIVEKAFMESFPVQVRARVAHESNDDPCDAIVERTLRWDLSPLRERYRASYGTGSGAIAIQLRGALGLPLYVF
jgi:hypothetical protein